MCAGASISAASRLSVKSSNQNGRSANGSSASFSSSLSLLVASSSLRSNTEPEDEFGAVLFQRLGMHLVPTILVVVVAL